MDFFINLGVRLQGLTATIMDLVPLLGAVGGIAGVAGSVLTRAGSAHDPAGLLHALHPTLEEAATFSLSWGLLKAHFKHQDNVKAIADAVAIPLPNAPK